MRDTKGLLLRVKDGAPRNVSAGVCLALEYGIASQERIKAILALSQKSILLND